MKVILLENVKRIGSIGEVIDVITGNPIVKLINGTIIIYDYESSIDLKKGDILE